MKLRDAMRDLSVVELNGLLRECDISTMICEAKRVDAKGAAYLSIYECERLAATSMNDALRLLMSDPEEVKKEIDQFEPLVMIVLYLDTAENVRAKIL